MSQQGAVVFVGGSRTITQIPALLHTRLERIVARSLAVVVGDAPGADAAVQGYFAERAYPHTVVYHSGTRCRTNVGAWPTCAISTSAQFGTAAFYTVKDAAMTAAASCGLMLWDGASRGTQANVVRLVQQGKPVLVYHVPAQTAITVCSLDDVAQLRSGVADKLVFLPTERYLRSVRHPITLKRVPNGLQRGWCVCPWASSP